MFRILTAAALAAAAVAATLFFAQPPGQWPQYQASPAHNAVLPGSLRANWTTPLDGKVNGGFALVNGTLFADSFDRNVYAIDAGTGEIKWRTKTGNIVMSTPVVQHGILVVGTGKDGFLKPLDASSQVWGRPQGDDVIGLSADTGAVIWKLHTIGEDMPSPAIDNGTVYLSNGDAHAYALDLSSGKTRWISDLPGIATMASAALHDGRFFVSICHNAPYYCQTRALDMRTGKTLWINASGGSDCTPTIDGGLLFIETSGTDVAPFHTGGIQTVVAMDERTGKTRWTHTFSPAPYTYIASSERQITGTAVDGTLYESIGNLARVVAFDERTGKIRWSVHTSGNVKMSPLVTRDRVYFGDTEGVFYDVARSNGRIIKTTSFLQPFSVGPPIIWGGTIFIADGNVLLAMPIDTL